MLSVRARLCKYLHESGIHSRDGKGFPNTTLNRIIKNVMYTGVIKNGDSRSAYLEELRIIDDATFDRAQQIMRERTMPRSSVPRNCKGSSLLVGNIFCAHCGNRLTLTTSGRKKTGTSRWPSTSVTSATTMSGTQANATGSLATPYPRWIPWSNRSCG